MDNSIKEKGEIPEDWRLMFAPKLYSSLAMKRVATGAWIAWRRPLFVAFAIACGATFMATGQLSFGSVVLAMTYWSYVPAVECLALLLAYSNGSSMVSRAELIDTYFVSHAPWLIWMTGWALLTNWLPTKQALTLSGPWIFGGGCVALVWSLWIDWHFFRCYCQQSKWLATRTLIVQRLLSWPIILGVFSYGSLWANILEVLHL